MSRNIEIPGYETFVPNCLWRRKSKPVIRGRDNQEVLATELFYLVKIDIPTNEQVVDLIRKGAKNFKSGKVEEKLGDLLKYLGPKSIKKLEYGDKDYIKHLETHFPETPFINPGETRLFIGNGVIPDELLNPLEKGIYDSNEQARTDAIDRASLRCKDISMLFEDNSLPNKKTVDALLKHKVKECNLFRQLGDDYKTHAEFVEKIDLVYKLLKSERNRKELKDDSDILLRKTAFLTLRNIINCSYSQGVGIIHIDSLTEIIGSALEAVNKKSYGCDFSLN